MYERCSKNSRPLVLWATRQWNFDHYFFNIISLQGNSRSPFLLKFSYPFEIEGLFLVPQGLVYFLYYAFIASILCTKKMEFQFWEQIKARRSHIGRKWGMRMDFKSTFSHSSHCNLWCALSCKSTTLRVSCPCLFPGIAASIHLHNMNFLSCNLIQDNQSWSALDYPKRLGSSPSLLNEPS